MKPAGLLPSQRDRGNPDIHDLPSTAQCAQFQTYIGRGAANRRDLRLWQQAGPRAYDTFLRERMGSTVVDLGLLGAPKALDRQRQASRQRQHDLCGREALLADLKAARGQAALEGLTS